MPNIVKTFPGGLNFAKWCINLTKTSVALQPFSGIPNAVPFGVLSSNPELKYYTKKAERSDESV